MSALPLNSASAEALRPPLASTFALPASDFISPPIPAERSASAFALALLSIATLSLLISVSDFKPPSTFALH